MVAGIRMASIDDGKVGNKAKESSDRRKYQAKTSKSKNLKTHDQEILAIFEAPE